MRQVSATWRRNQQSGSQVGQDVGDSRKSGADPWEFQRIGCLQSLLSLLVGIAVELSRCQPDRSADAGSPNALPGSVPAPYRLSRSAARSGLVRTPNVPRRRSRHGSKSGYR